MKAKRRYIWANVKLVGTIVPIVLVMIAIFFLLVRIEILTLAKEKLSLESKHYAAQINSWAESILHEVTVYKTMAEKLGLSDKRVYDLLGTSLGSHDAFPYGLYLGDDQGNYFDASGWVPDADYAVTKRNWYQEGVTHEQFSFGEPYTDAMTGGVCVSVSCRLNTTPAVTVLSADVYPDYASQVISQIISDKIDHAFFATKDSRLILADANADLVGTSLNAEQGSLLYQNINKLLDQGITGQREVMGDASLYFVDINVIEDTGWYFVTCMNRNAVLKSLWRIETPIIIVALIASILLFVLTSLFSKEMSDFRSQSRIDSLTKLLNREGFEEFVRISMEERPQQGYLLLLNLDNFKWIKDRFGHPKGDQTLIAFATLLETFFNRNRDIVCHLSGDNFAVFVGRDITRAEAEGMLKRFMAVMRQTLDEKLPDLKLTASVGASPAAHSEDYDQLYQNTDKALYEAKWGGKNRFVIL